MKKIFISVVLFASFLLANGLKYKEFNGFENPESIFIDKDFIYVSNIGKKLEPLSKDHDGFISRLDKNGNILDYKFLSNMDAPKGMMKISNVLYIADVDVVRGFDLSNKKEIFKLPIKNAIFLNDIEKLNNNTLLVSDTGTGIIHEIDIKHSKYKDFLKLDIEKFGGPNGLYLYKNTLFIAGYDAQGKGGLVISYDLKSKKISIIKNEKESYDGIALDGNNLLVSSWGNNLNGLIYSINLKDNKIKKLSLPFMKGPADILLNKNNLWIPLMAENKIIKVKLEN
ncbi:YncE family protein [Campylobacter novaezeelandiae]|uniref:YncE family protein n=1 Tax=Campylobacter novaezeelandiae TaxID=2267891 RepID=UPI001906EF9D|nr:ATP-binding protein [Campylobacter novaezeelandiae]MBK1963994.1 ATP-binding protein [Campylobacter novaezeelandiae]MBK1993603.1 ATP-binding protein [Campylobacter novaezeelandiae]